MGQGKHPSQEKSANIGVSFALLIFIILIIALIARRVKKPEEHGIIDRDTVTTVERKAIKQ